MPSILPRRCLHDAFQAVLGWTDSHLHQWEKEGKYWGVPDDDGFDGDIDVIDESKVPVAKLLLAEGETMVYVYDFGDNWRNQVVLEKILPTDAPTKPICLAGRRRRPPEDIGGPSGYQEFLKVLVEPGHEVPERFRAWTGGAFHPEEFDVKVVNTILERMRWPVRHRR